MGGGTSLSSHRAGFGVFWSKGFTLAEVLITLAIIGIVAALTIPTLVQNFQQDAWDTASEVFQRKLEESLKVMNVQGTLAGYTTTEAFVDELSKHIKITRICDNDDITTCFADKVYWGKEGEEPEEVDMSEIKTSESFGQKDWDTNTVAVQFTNGINAVIAYNPACTQNQFSNQVTGEKCLAILYDVDGFKNPNTVSKDLRNNDNVLALAGVKSGFCISDGTCFTAPFYPTPITRAECEQLVADGYPIKKCYYDYDRWAGAVKACHDMGSSLPSVTELMKLEEELYQDASGTTSFSRNRDNDLAFEMGFLSSASTSSFTVWSSEEFSMRNAFGQDFSSTNTSWYNSRRTNSNYQAVCLAE